MDLAIPGLVTAASALAPADTMARLESEIRGKGLTVFAKIDHSGGASDAGLALRFTQLLIFGSAKGGTPLMQSRQTIGIDLPLKLLVWEDEGGATRVSWEDPARLAKRHGIADRPDTVAALSRLLTSLSGSVAG
jgi:uncharacterized protein (DUF302 family)